MEFLIGGSVKLVWWLIAISIWGCQDCGVTPTMISPFQYMIDWPWRARAQSSLRGMPFLNSCFSLLALQSHPAPSKKRQDGTCGGGNAKNHLQRQHYPRV
jgi:hypothetical protein